MPKRWLIFCTTCLTIKRSATDGAHRVLHSTAADQFDDRNPAGLCHAWAKKRGEFGWDNEFDQHQVNVPGFRIGKYKVTNGEYLEFVREGAPAPHFWTRTRDDWFYRGMFSEIPLPLNAPVYVTHDEAAAYARWARQTAAHRSAIPSGRYIETSDGAERPYPWGERSPDEARGNFDFHHWDPVDVNANPAGDSASGVSQLMGNGWEWTSTQFGPFPGFQPMPFYPGYSQNFFDEEHYVMKGGSPVTAACMLAPLFPQLVPSQLSLCLRKFPIGRRLS